MNPINIGTCEKCKAPALSHQACKECGFYKGRQSVDHTRDAQRAIAKQQQASAPAHDHDHGNEKAEAAPDTEKKSAE